MWLSLVNHLGKRWSSLVEIMAMMAVVSMAITAMFSTVIWGIYFSRDSENRIKAINLAREWIEWVTNLRNTNWLRFSGDQNNCWSIKDYQAACIGSGTYASTNSFGGSPASKYVLKNENGAWYLTWTTSGSWLWVDSNGFYFSSGTTPWDLLCTINRTTNCRSPFTREIRILSGSNTMTITSIVDWNERVAQNVTLTTTLTNWKRKF